jgi:hypothetical protein
MRRRDSAEPGRNSGSAENGRWRMYVRVGRRSRRAGSCRRSRCGRCGRCSRCSVCARGCRNRRHGGCAGGSPAPRRCSYPGRTSVSRRSAGACWRPTARCRSGWCSADRVGWPARRANRGHGRCCGRQRCAHRFGADDRAAARPAAAAGSPRVKPKEKPPEPSRGAFLWQDEKRCTPYSLTTTGSPMLTVLKYHSASAGLRLMQP